MHACLKRLRDESYQPQGVVEEVYDRYLSYCASIYVLVVYLSYCVSINYVLVCIYTAWCMCVIVHDVLSSILMCFVMYNYNYHTCYTHL